MAVGVVDALLQLEHLPWWFDDAFKLLLARIAPRVHVPDREPFSEPDAKARRQMWAPIRENLDLGGAIPRIDLPGCGPANVFMTRASGTGLLRAARQ